MRGGSELIETPPPLLQTVNFVESRLFGFWAITVSFDITVNWISDTKKKITVWVSDCAILNGFGSLSRALAFNEIIDFRKQTLA